MEQTLPINNLSIKQAEAIGAVGKYKYVLFSGGVGCGKTTACHVIHERYPEAVLFASDSTDKSFRGRNRFSHQVLGDDKLLGYGRVRFIIVEDAHVIRPQVLERCRRLLWNGDGWMFFTARVIGPGLEWIRRYFPTVGECSPESYHVNASPLDNPWISATARAQIERLLAEAKSNGATDNGNEPGLPGR